MAWVENEIVAGFDALIGGAGDAEREALFARCRAEAPIFFSEALGAWVLARYDDVRAVLEDDGYRTLTDGPGSPIYGRSMLQWEGVEHNKKSGPVVKRIRSPRAIRESIDGKVAEIARRTADGLPLGEPVDLRADYVMVIPLLVITELLDIHEAGRFRSLYDAMMKGGISSIADPGLRVAAFEALGQPARDRRPGRRGTEGAAGQRHDLRPRDRRATTASRIRPRRSSPRSRSCSQPASRPSSARLTSLLRHLALDREEWDRLCARIDDRDYVLSVSAESLRLYPPVQGTIRRATGAADFHGTTVRPDDKLIVMIASANRDETTVRGGRRVPGRALPGQPRPAVHERGGRAAVRRRPAPLRRLAPRGDRDGPLAATARPPHGLDRASRPVAGRRGAAAPLAADAARRPASACSREESRSSGPARWAPCSEATSRSPATTSRSSTPGVSTWRRSPRRAWISARPLVRARSCRCGAVYEPELLEPVELVIVLTKTFAGAEALRSIVHALGARDLGRDGPERARQRPPAGGGDRARAGRAGHDDGRRGAARAGSRDDEPRDGRPHVGHASRASAQRCAAPGGVRTIAATLTEAGLPAEALDSADVVIWTKLALAGPMGPVTALLRRTVADVIANEHALALVTEMFDEIVAVAHATGVPLTARGCVGARRGDLARRRPAHDLDGGRRARPAPHGDRRLLRRGRPRSAPSTACRRRSNRAVWQALKAVEATYDRAL